MAQADRSIQAVIFDFGGVLCLHPDDLRWNRAAETAGIPAEEFKRAFWTNRIEYDAGRLSPVEYWQDLARRAGIRLDDGKIPVLIQREIELWNQYDPRVFAWIGRLRAAGCRTAILSNLPQPLGEALRATPGFLEHFDHVTFSYELRVVKPEAGIYRDTIRGLGVQPERALFLDDKAENTEGARAVGLRAELYSTWEAFAASGVPGDYDLPLLGMA